MKCKACGAEIIWLRTTDGKKMPCDQTPMVLRAWMEGDLWSKDHHPVHWDTCNKPDLFRKQVEKRKS